MKLIVSIHGKWLDKIKDGSKTIEVRRTIPKKPIDKGEHFIYWYNTDTKKIEGFSKLITVASMDMHDTIYNDIVLTIAIAQTLSRTQLTKDELKEYQGERDCFYFWYIENYTDLEPFTLPKGKRAPQDWCYYDTIMGDGVSEILELLKEQFLEKDKVIKFSRNTGGSQPTQYTYDIEIKDKKVYVSGKTGHFYQPPKEYKNSLLRESEVELLFINVKKYDDYEMKNYTGSKLEYVICSRLISMFYR